MKACCTPLLVAALLASRPAEGQDAKPAPSPPPITLTYPYTSGIAASAIPPTTEFAATKFYAYGDGPLTLMLTVQAPLGTRLRIFADVSQHAGSISAPWERNTPVTEDIVFTDRTSMTVECKLPTLRAVQRKTQVSVTLRTEPKKTYYPAGLVIQGFVYPREEPGAWKKQFAAMLSHAGIRRVAVFGGWKNTAIFLRNQKFAFDDLGSDWPSEPDAHTLYLGSVFPKPDVNTPLTIPRVFGETPGVRLVLFEPWDSDVLPPGVYQTAGTAGGGIWKVTLPDLFAGANFDDPHGLETLTTILQQALAPRRTTTTSSDDSPEPTL